MRFSYSSLFLLGCSVALTFGCAKQNSLAHLYENQPTKMEIIGGNALQEKDSAASFVALLFDQKKDTFCTGFLIQKDILITAAHCLSENLADTIVAFGTKPRTGRYQLRTLKAALPHPDFNAQIKGRNDLAVLQLTSPAPDGTKLLSLPETTFPLIKGLKFTALGFGQTQGTKTKVENGELRSVVLEIASMQKENALFFVNQKDGKGICHGDSGGPAIMRFQNKDYAVGVASAISWSTPKSAHEDQKNDLYLKTDICSERSIYMNLQEYRSWLESALALFGYDLMNNI